MPVKNSNNTIGNRSRDLPVCSEVPQPLRHRVPPKYTYMVNLISLCYVTLEQTCIVKCFIVIKVINIRLGSERLY
jgi:hypothetical protein